MQLILASSSKNRQLVLKTLHIPFKVIPSNIDEKIIKETDPSSRAKKLARLKGEFVEKKHQGAIISADTFTLCQGKIVEKPINKAEAKKMLQFLSGKTAVNYTGFFYFDRKNNISVSETVPTIIRFRQFYQDEVAGYLKKFPVTSWAAAYAASELYVMGMIKSVSGSLTGLTHGLPIDILIPLLRRSGFSPKP